MTKKTFFAFTVVMIMSMSWLASCNDANESGYMVLRVSYTGTVDSTNKLYAQFYTGKDWSSPIYKQGSATTTIVVPEFVDINMPFYFVVFHDLDADGNLSTGDPFIGWFNVTDTSTDLMAIKFTSGPLMLNITLDPLNTYP